MVNDEYSDVTFALYALKAQGEPHRRLVRDAEVLRQRLLHVPGVKKVNIIGGKGERSFAEFPKAASPSLAVSLRAIFPALTGPTPLRPPGAIEPKAPKAFISL